MLIGKNSSSVHTEDLLADMAKTKLADKLLISLAVHVVLVLVTSVSFIGLCFKYSSLHPRREMERQRREAAAAEQESLLAQRLAAGESSTNVTATAEGAQPAEPSATEEAPAGGKSAIEQELEEKSSSRPEHSNMAFDEIDSI
jgi:hypothetical protein